MPRLAYKQGRPAIATLGSRVRAERERLGLSQAEAARRLQVQRSNYAQIERGTVLQYGVLLALVLDLGMSPRALAPELFSGDRAGRGGPSA